MEILSERKRVEVVEYHLMWQGPGGRGFSFDCDKHGVVDESIMAPAGIENLRKCRAGEMEGYSPQGVEACRRSYTEAAIGKCDCGRRVALSQFTNTCDCGREYSMDGGMLAPRDQWGWETGEHPADVGNISLDI